MAADPSPRPAAAVGTMTITIASHQRRGLLERLLRVLSAQLAGAPDLQPGLDVVVVLDGSNDGSAEMVETLPFPVPLRAVRQPHLGLAAARNAGLEAARGELVCFLDDDLVPGPSLLATHRRVERPGDRRVVVGPCTIPPDQRVHPLVRAFWEERHDDLSRTGAVHRFDHFSAANTSGPVSTFTDVGGFDPGFVGYGAEDLELGFRLLDRGVEIAYVPSAMAWHRPPHGALEMCTRMRSEGRNQIRLVTAHPEAFDVMFPGTDKTWPWRWIGRLRLDRAPWLLDALSSALLPVVLVEARVTRGRSVDVLGFASAARFVASVVRHDPDGRFTARVLGRDAGST
jgi:glycosyltransferase involved in cell wall biosynthesis